MTDKYYFSDVGYIKCDGSSCIINEKTNSTYVLYDDKDYSWEEAKNYCTSIGSHLLTINSIEEQNYIKENFVKYGKKNSYWLGGYRDGSTWKWITDEPFSYTNWASGQPDNWYKDEDKLHIYKERSYGYWNDVNGNGASEEEFFYLKNFGFICEWDNLVSFNSIDEARNVLINRNNNTIYFKKDINTEYSSITVGNDYIIETDLSDVASNTFLYDSVVYSFINQNESYSIKKLNTTGMNAFKIDNNFPKDISLIMMKSEEFENEIYEDDLNKIKLYDCKNGTCKKTIGYLKCSYDQVIECNEDGCLKFQEPIDCSNDYINNSNIAYYYNLKFVFCINSGNPSSNNVEEKVVEMNQYYFSLSSSKASSYYLYITNEYGNIVGRNTRDIDSDEKSDLVFCNSNDYGGLCNKSNNYGYFINAAGSTTNNLIYCTEDGCDTVTKEYVTSGNDRILLKIDNYSVTQYITDSEGVCINNDGSQDKNCDTQGSNIYVCTKNSSSCTTSLNYCDPKKGTGACNGYYLVDINEKTKIGKLYKCSNESDSVECKEQPKNTKGLFRITDKYYFTDVGYIKCDGSNCIINEKTNSTYVLYDDKDYSWEEAKNYCTSIGSHLLTINSDDELKYIKENFLKYGTKNLYWLGGYKDGSTWNWITDETFSYSNWASGKPDNFRNSEDKIIILNKSNFGYWDDIGVASSSFMYNNIVYSFTNQKSGYTIKKSYINGMKAFKIDDNYPKELSLVLIKNEEFNTDIEDIIPKMKIYECQFDNNYLVDIDGDNIDDLITCSANINGSKCSKIEAYGYFINNGSDNPTSLIYCDNNNNKCNITTKTNGYFINSNKNAIKCNSSKCESYIMSSSCSNNNNEVIKTYSYNEIKFCLEYKEVSFLKNDHYKILSNINIKTSDFPDIISGSDSILLRIDQYSVTNEYTDSKGICIMEDETKDENCNISGISKYVCMKGKSCTYSVNVCDPKTGKGGCFGYYLTDVNSEGVGNLYKCTYDDKNIEVSTCYSIPKTTVGLFKITDTFFITDFVYIKCNGNQCEKIKTIQNSSSCSGYAGNLINNSGIKFCINNSESINFDSENYKREIVRYQESVNDQEIMSDEEIVNDQESVNDQEIMNDEEIVNDQESESENIFDSTGCYLVSDIKQGIFYKNNKNYVLITTTKVSIIQEDISKGNDDFLFEKATNINGMYAFKKDNSTQYDTFSIILLNNNEFSNDITDLLKTTKIYDCLNGVCNETSGFIRYNTNKVVKCDNYCTYNQYITKCESSSEGNAFYNEQFKFCKSIKTISGEMKVEEVLVKSGNLLKFFSYSDDYYYLYQSSDNGNIIGKNTRGGDYYEDIDGDSKKDFISCSSSYIISNGSKCSKVNVKGYFLENENKNSNELIFCDNNYVCDLTKVSDGYYINSKDNVIKCYASICSNYSIKNSCSNNEFIKYNSDLMYCVGSNKYSLSDERIYPLSNVNAANSKFPNINSGSNTILVKFSNYAIKQYITSSSGICLYKDTYEDENCNTAGTNKYICTSISDPCSISVNYCNPKTNTGGCHGYYLTDIQATGEGTFYACINYKNGKYTCEKYDSDKVLTVKSGIYMINKQLYLIANDENDDKVVIVKLISNGMMAFESIKNPEYNIFNNTLIKYDQFKNNLNSRLVNINLYDCRNGLCNQTKGYIKYNTDFTPKVVYCDEKGCNKEIQYYECKSSNSGSAYYYSGEFNFCMSYKSSYSTYDSIFKYKAVSIKGGSTAGYFLNELNWKSIFGYSIFNSDQDSLLNKEKFYELYISDKGGNIIGLNTSDGCFNIDSDHDKKDNIVCCESGMCYEKIKSNTQVYDKYSVTPVTDTTESVCIDQNYNKKSNEECILDYDTKYTCLDIRYLCKKTKTCNINI
ncbi:hypothetical protein PIROE2DRAFT_59085 [Piromyces sp. E2]|nr:hypothetical protein PIROE2DRAFT_59085 [Piromyces sp. E2]|eukprot:OUM66913.1 hypothetical protein PIROE2DRAFT_59085 [Piromyces sp. E2]